MRCNWLSWQDVRKVQLLGDHHQESFQADVQNIVLALA
jgi:hypothetical protein